MSFGIISNLSAVAFRVLYVIYNLRRDFKRLAQNSQNRLHYVGKKSNESFKVNSDFGKRVLCTSM